MPAVGASSFFSTFRIYGQELSLECFAYKPAIPTASEPQLIYYARLRR